MLGEFYLGMKLLAWYKDLNGIKNIISSNYKETLFVTIESTNKKGKKLTNRRM
jgi:hypothetical protein